MKKSVYDPLQPVLVEFVCNGKQITQRCMNVVPPPGVDITVVKDGDTKHYIVLSVDWWLVNFTDAYEGSVCAGDKRPEVIVEIAERK